MRQGRHVARVGEGWKSGFVNGRHGVRIDGVGERWQWTCTRRQCGGFASCYLFHSSENLLLIFRQQVTRFRAGDDANGIFVENLGLGLKIGKLGLAFRDFLLD